VCVGSNEPATGCRAAAGGALTFRDRSPDTKDQVVWKWSKGAETVVGDLGDPIAGTTGYTLCIYDGDGVGGWRRALRASAPPGGLCHAKPCWRPLGPGGLRYDDRDLTPNGIRSLKIKIGPTGKANIGLKGKGDRLGLPSLPLLQAPTVTVQLRNDEGLCWESVLAPPARRNDTGQFRDKQ
jgi:hypothetical protein